MGIESSRMFREEGDMKRYVAIMNSKFSGAEFTKKMVDTATDDPDVRVKSLGDKVLVTTRHFGGRATGRTFATRDQVESILAELMTPVVVETVARHKVVYVAKTGDVVSVGKYHSTAIIDEKHRLVFIVEAGWDYVLAVTVMDYGPGSCCGARDGSGKVSIRPDQAPIRVDANGFVHIGEVNEFVTVQCKK